MEHPKENIFKKNWVQSISGIILIAVVVFIFLFYKSITSYVSTEDAHISSPIISISPEYQGILEEVYVNEGDKANIDDPLARVGTEILRAKVGGIITYTSNTPGQVFNPSTPVIKMVNPNESRLVATLKEDAGLSKLAVGDPVSFTLDAFPGEKYTGIVEEINPTSDETSVVFSISDTRVTKNYTIKIKYDISNHSEFKNGMSAKVKIYYKK